MGAVLGTPASKNAERSRLKNVFSKELSRVTGIVNNILAADGTFASKEYNFLSRDACAGYTVVLESQLKRHLKVDVQSLHDSLLMIPKRSRVAAGDHVIDKAELCSVISNHYVRILYLLSLIKLVFDLEHGGDVSIAGIVYRNVRVVGDLMEINYCAIPQKDYGSSSRDVDFSALQGLQFFLDKFLDPEEQHVFLHQMRMVLGRRVDVAWLRDVACAHALMRPEDYAQLYRAPAKGAAAGKAFACSGSGAGKAKKEPSSKLAVDFVAAPVFAVAAMNPVFSGDQCMSRRKVVLQISKDKESKAVHQTYTEMTANYQANLRAVEALLAQLVRHEGGDAWALRDIDDDALDRIVTDTKRTVARFYLQSIIDFQRLLHAAKSMPSITVD